MVAEKIQYKNTIDNNYLMIATISKALSRFSSKMFKRIQNYFGSFLCGGHMQYFYLLIAVVFEVSGTMLLPVSQNLRA